MSENLWYVRLEFGDDFRLARTASGKWIAEFAGMNCQLWQKWPGQHIAASEAAKIRREMETAGHWREGYRLRVMKF